VHIIQQAELLQETSDISLVVAIRAQAENKAGLWKIAPPSQENIRKNNKVILIRREEE
jgi:hypothetical protein